MALYNNVKGDKKRVTSDQHIYIFTIAFRVADEGAARTMLQNCATPPNECLGNQCYFESRLSRRCRVFLPTSRLDSISYDLQIEFGLE